MQSGGFRSPLPDFGQEGVFWGAIQPIFLARVRVRRFAEKAFTLHHGSQTPDTKSLMGEAFTSNQLYHNKFRRIGEEVKVKTQNSWMRARTRTREDGEMYMSLKKQTCI